MELQHSEDTLYLKHTATSLSKDTLTKGLGLGAGSKTKVLEAKSNDQSSVPRTPQQNEGDSSHKLSLSFI